ncbi:MAG: HTH-type transcriptional repressor KstR2 [Steroidobacteraceae bacterium]|nr:HTH-type transcriptional repressor KstR2 [Steroidobacteraceae bacterium]
MPGPISPWRVTGTRERRRELKRDAVILAAARAFRARGYHHTSLDDIAALLHVTKPTLYYYVASKEEMLFECFRAGLDRIATACSKARRGTASGREQLIEVVRSYVEAITSDFGWCMVRAEDQDLGPELGARIRQLKSEIDQEIRRLVRAGIADGSIGDCDPKMVAFALAGALNWIPHWYRDNASLPASAIADRFVEVFVHGLAPRREGALPGKSS